MASLQSLFQNKKNALYHPIEWPYRSPDLIPLDFCLWGYIKSHVYDPLPKNTNQLKDQIRNVVAMLMRSRMVCCAINEMHTRARRCVRLGLRLRGWRDVFEHGYCCVFSLFILSCYPVNITVKVVSCI